MNSRRTIFETSRINLEKSVRSNITEFGKTRKTCFLSIRSNMYKLKVFYDLCLFIFVIIENVQYMTLTKILDN